jgi:predicted membrane protein
MVILLFPAVNLSFCFNNSVRANYLSLLLSCLPFFSVLFSFFFFLSFPVPLFYLRKNKKTEKQKVKKQNPCNSLKNKKNPCIKRFQNPKHKTEASIPVDHLICHPPSLALSLSFSSNIRKRNPVGPPCMSNYL